MATHVSPLSNRLRAQIIGHTAEVTTLSTKPLPGVSITIDKVEPPCPTEHQPVTLSYTLSPAYNIKDAIHNGTIKLNGSDAGAVRVEGFKTPHVTLGQKSTTKPITGKIQFMAPAAVNRFPLRLEFLEDGVEAVTTVYDVYQLPVAAEYQVEIVSATLGATRAVDNDTVVVSFACYCADNKQTAGPTGYGDRGTHGEVIPLNVQFKPVTSVPADGPDIEVSWTILNQGYKGSAMEWLNKILGFANNAGEIVANNLAPEGKAYWPAVHDATEKINNTIAGDCDGVIAAEQLTLNGAHIDELTRQNGVYDDQFRFQGGVSPAGCGRSDYTVKVRVTRTSFAH